MPEEVLCSKQQIKDRFFPVECYKCKWRGCSCEASGGEQIADTGDYGDLECPKCGGLEVTETTNTKEKQNENRTNAIWLLWRSFWKRLPRK